MINGYSAQQVRAAEGPHLAAGEPLMQRAAAGLAGVLRELMPARDGRVLLLVGSGDNGGDALFAGAALAADGVRVDIVATGERMHEAGLRAAVDAGAAIVDQHVESATHSNIVVDGILGTGTSANPALRGTARDIVAALRPVVERPGGPMVVAVDIPSGINPNDGAVPDPTVLAADVTVTFGAYKAGLLLKPASAYAGEIRLIDLGLGPDFEGVEPLVRVTR